MADPADIAAQHEFSEEALTTHRNSTKVTAPRGKCLYCEAHLQDNLIFCDLDCRDAFEREQKIARNTRR